jgi:hypothetical protein
MFRVSTGIINKKILSVNTNGNQERKYMNDSKENNQGNS